MRRGVRAQGVVGVLRRRRRGRGEETSVVGLEGLERAVRVRWERGHAASTERTCPAGRR